MSLCCFALKIIIPFSFYCLFRSMFCLILYLYVKLKITSSSNVFGYSENGFQSRIVKLTDLFFTFVLKQHSNSIQFNSMLDIDLLELKFTAKEATRIKTVSKLKLRKSFVAKQFFKILCISKSVITLFGLYVCPQLLDTKPPSYSNAIYTKHNTCHKTHFYFQGIFHTGKLHKT